MWFTMWIILFYTTWSPVPDDLKCLFADHQWVIEGYHKSSDLLLSKVSEDSSLNPAWDTDCSNCLLNSYISANLFNPIRKLFWSPQNPIARMSTIKLWVVWKSVGSCLYWICYSRIVQCTMKSIFCEPF